LVNKHITLKNVNIWPDAIAFNIESPSFGYLFLNKLQPHWISQLFDYQQGKLAKFTATEFEYKVNLIKWVITLQIRVVLTLLKQIWAKLSEIDLCNYSLRYRLKQNQKIRIYQSFNRFI